MECAIRSNGGTRICVWHSHKENGDVHVWHSHKDNGDTHICVTFTKWKVGQFHSAKNPKRCGSSHNIKTKVWNKRKQKSMVWQSHKTRTVPLGNWRICVAVHTWKRVWHSPRRKKTWFRQSATFAIVTNKYKWSSSKNKTEPS